MNLYCVPVTVQSTEDIKVKSTVQFSFRIPLPGMQAGSILAEPLWETHWLPVAMTVSTDCSAQSQETVSMVKSGDSWTDSPVELNRNPGRRQILGRRQRTEATDTKKSSGLGVE